MEYRRLGKSGLKVSALSYGAWVTFATQMGEEEATACMAAAWDAGVNFFDNAEGYAAGEAEVLMGKILKKMAWRRDEWIVSSKVFWGGKKPTQTGLSRKHVRDACHAALKRLQVDYLDLYFCHRPDPETPVEETVRAMSDLVRQGHVLYWGTSEWSATEIMQAHAVAAQHGLEPPSMEQPQYNMFHRARVEEDYARLYRDFGMGTTIWSPLASGMLTGKYSDPALSSTRVDLPGYEWLKAQFESEEGRSRLRKSAELAKLAQELGLSLPEMALAWCLKNPHVSTVITGASKAAQVKQNMRAVDALPKLTPDVMTAIDTVLS